MCVDVLFGWIQRGRSSAPSRKRDLQNILQLLPVGYHSPVRPEVVDVLLMFRNENKKRFFNQKSTIFQTDTSSLYLFLSLSLPPFSLLPSSHPSPADLFPSEHYIYIYKKHYCCFVISVLHTLPMLMLFIGHDLINLISFTGVELKHLCC